MSKGAFANEAVPTAVAGSIGEVGARAATVDDTATMTDYITFFQVTPGVSCYTAATAVADGCPPPTGMPLFTRGAVLAHETSLQLATTPAQSPLTITGDARGGAGEEEFGIRFNSGAAAAAATTDSVADIRRE